MAELYPVNETFLSWQGEGVHLGRKAFFIRLQGCPVKCTWCDSASTWHPQFVPKDLRRASAADLAAEAVAARPEFVVLTGGEPCIHDLAPLVEALRSVGLPAHLETCLLYTSDAADDIL
jgi:7-carboxy-7-deazaguanine synthase